MYVDMINVYKYNKLEKYIYAATIFYLLQKNDYFVINKCVIKI